MLFRFKKSISLLLVFILLFSASISASAEIDTSVLERVSGLGLMEGYEDGSFGEEDELTRAQLCMIAARLLQMEGVKGTSNPYTDVAEDYWARDVIATLSNLNILNGVGDGIFAPDKNVSFSEAAKIIVCVLGYSEQAEEMGGYPFGYIAQAGALGLLKNVDSQSDAITRGDVAQIIYNALNVKPTGEFFLKNYNKLQFTLYEILKEAGDLVQFSGVLTETAASSLSNSEPNLKDGYVIVGGIKLETDIPMDEYLGCALNGFAYVDNAGKPYKIKSFALDDENIITNVDFEDLSWDGDIATVYTDSDKGEKYKMSDEVKTIYNGRLASIPDSERNIFYGSYKFVDNDGNGYVDVLFINEAQSFVIEKVNSDSSTVYFQNRATLNGRNAVVFDSEDEDRDVALVDKDGNEFSVDDLKEDMALTIFASSDNKYIKAIVSDEQVTGTVSAKSDKGVKIDGKIYGLSKKPDGSTNIDPDVNDDGTYALDYYGKIVSNVGTVQSSYLYAYVIDAAKGSGLSKQLRLKMVSGLSPRKDVKESGGTEIITYYFQNDEIKIYECESSFNLNDVRVDSDEVNENSLKECLVAFKLNDEGRVKELHTYNTSGQSIDSSYSFNANLISFGGENVSRGYVTDKNTAYVCVPKHADSDDDYYIQLKITDDSDSNEVLGTVFFPDANYEDSMAEPVDILMIKGEMDSSAIVPVPPDGDVCIVGDVSFTLDDKNDEMYSIEMLNGGEKITEVAEASGNINNVLKTLRKGDLVRYVKDGFGRITNITKLISVQGLGNSYANNLSVGSGVEYAMYGQAYHVVPNTYDYLTNQMVDRIRFNFSTDVSADSLSNTYRLFHEEPPAVYKYERNTGWISEGSIEDIRTYNQIGEGADNILAIIESNDIKALVIIAE